MCVRMCVRSVSVWINWSSSLLPTHKTLSHAIHSRTSIFWFPFSIDLIPSIESDLYHLFAQFIFAESQNRRIALSGLQCHKNQIAYKVCGLRQSLSPNFVCREGIGHDATQSFLFTNPISTLDFEACLV